MGKGKSDELELASDMAHIAELMHMRITSKSELMDRINAGRPPEKHVSRQTIANDIDRLKKEWRESALYDYNEAWNQQMDEYNYLKRLAYQEFFKSMGIKLTVTLENGKTIEFEDIMGDSDEMTPEDLLAEAQAAGGKTIIKKEVREGNVAFMQLIERIMEKQAKMRGVDGATKVALTKADGQDVGSLTDGIIAALGKVRASLGKTNEEYLREAEDAEELASQPVALLTTGSHDEDDDDES